MEVGLIKTRCNWSVMRKYNTKDNPVDKPSRVGHNLPLSLSSLDENSDAVVFLYVINTDLFILLDST